MKNDVLQRSIQRINQTLIILLIFYFTVLGGFFMGVQESRWRLITYIISGLLLGGWLIYRLRRKQAWPRTPLDWPLLAIIATMTISTLTSTDPRLSLGSLLLTLAYVLCFYFAVDLTKNRALSEKIINAILVTALIICTIGAFEYWQWYYGDWKEISFSESSLPWSLAVSWRITSVLYNPNMLAYYLLSVLGILFYKFAGARNYWTRLGWGVGILTAAGFLFLTQSRGGLLGTITVLLIFLGLYFWEQKGINVISSISQICLSWPSIFGAVLVLGFLLLLLVPLINRLVQSNPYEQRDDVWEPALAAAATYPWLGSGLGTFGQQYLIFRGTNSDLIHTHAHNLWLTFAVEGGLVGLAAIFWLNITFVWVMFKSLQKPAKESKSLLKIAALAILGGMAVHNLFDDFHDPPMLALYTIFFVALALNLCNANTRNKVYDFGRFRNAPNILAMVLLLFIGGIAFKFLTAFIAYDSAQAAAAQDNWPQAAQYLEQAVARDPGYRFYRQQLVLAQDQLISKETSLLPQAIAEQTFLLQENNHYSLDNANLACLYYRAGDLPAVIQAMALAVEMEPKHTEPQYSQGSDAHVSRLAYQFSLVQFYEKSGQMDSAQEVLAQILEAYPWVAASSFWDERPQQLQTLVSHIEQTLSLTSTDNLVALADLYYYAGHYQKSGMVAKQLLTNDTQNVSHLTCLGRALAQQGDAKAALAVLDQALTLAPYSHTSRLIRAQILIRQGRLQEAESDLRIVVALNPVAEAYTTWGGLAERQQRIPEAKKYYELAVLKSTSLQTNYAHLVGRREPLPVEALNCIVVPYPKQELAEPALALGRLLETEGNHVEAMKVYELLLDYEPYNQTAQEQIDQIKAQLSISP